ncbi:hypothetical protein [Amycolatopsis sp. lyj-90]|uniref:hypothetical protein n=1 Tax=Amycolatopsis sp. lyj-90 TaxID=2789285 RepID=UPI00397A2AF6
MGILDRMRRTRTRSAAAGTTSPSPSSPAEPSIDDLYLTLRAPVFRDPHSGDPGPLDPHGDLIRTAVLGGDTAAAWRFRPELDLFQPWLVFEEPTGENHVVMPELLEKLGADRETVIERARATTAGLLGGTGGAEVKIGDGGPAKSFAVRSVRSSRRTIPLVAPALLEPWRNRVPGELLVLPACDDDIMIIGADGEYLEIMVSSAIDHFRSSGNRRLSPAPYAIVDGALSPWRPPEDSPAYPTVREAEVIQRVVAYADFLEYLREHLHGVEADVAAAQRGENAKTSLPFSYSSTTLVGPTQYLPFVEYVGFENLDPQQDDWAWIPFDRLRDLPGATMTPAWQYGLPVVRFEPPADPGTRRQISAALREYAENPW